MLKVTQPSLVDIVIPIHNREEHTRQTLESLVKNTDPGKFNLYLIDDVSNDGTTNYLYRLHHGTDELLSKISGNFFYNTVNIGPGASRNYVCSFITKKKLRSKYLYHSDNDVFFSPGWLEKLLEAYDAFKTVGGVLLGGGCHPYLQNRFVEVLGGIRIGIKDAVSGYSHLLDWESWDTYGKFDEGTRGLDRKIMGSEDWEYCQRIIKAGYKVGSLEPEVVIATGKTNTYGDPATGHETFKTQEGVMIK